MRSTNGPEPDDLALGLHAARFFALPPEGKAFNSLTEGVLNRGYDGIGSRQSMEAAPG